MILTAIADNPSIGMAMARSIQSKAAVGASKAAMYPQLDGSIGSGWGTTGTYQGTTAPYFDPKNASGAIRTELNGSAKQLLYNFGATAKDIQRATYQADADTLRVVGSTEDTAYSAAQVYIKLIQLRDLLDLADENLRSLNEIAQLVSENEKNGNATVADVKRVNARVVDSQASRSDTDYELQITVDRFRRLTHTEPKTLRPPPNLSAAIPPDHDAAIAEAVALNPGVQIQVSTIKAAQAEIDSIRGGGLPRIGLDGLISNKYYENRQTKTEIDMRGLVSMSYKFLDGGLISKQVEQASGRALEAEMKLRSVKEDLEAEVRQNYLLISASRRKATSLAEGVADSAKARELYQEQFQGGKRSLLELLDVQNSYYTARRAMIVNTFEERQAVYAILKSLGRFVRTTLGAASQA